MVSSETSNTHPLLLPPESRRPSMSTLTATKGLKRKRSSVSHEEEEQQQQHSNGEGSSSGGGGDQLDVEGTSSLATGRKRINYQEIPSDEDLDSEEERVVKKHKKEKEPKPRLPEWKDLQDVHWEEGDEFLGRFPNEILDLIISVDSDLDVSSSMNLDLDRWEQEG